MERLSSTRELGSQAVRMPPLEPAALLETKEEDKFGGRKVAALKKLQSLSFVSCRQTIVGEAERIASRTIVHFSGSPRPRTFQENKRKVFEDANILN
jgi:hypothetical protein